MNHHLANSILQCKKFKQREYIQYYNQWCKLGCTSYIVPAHIQHILFWFGIYLQSIFYPLWWSSLILSLLIIFWSFSDDHIWSFSDNFSDDHLWSPLRATLLNSLDPSAPKLPIKRSFYFEQQFFVNILHLWNIYSKL